MSNCIGFIYGMATSSSDGAPIPNVDVTLNFVQEAEGYELKTGGNDDLTAYVPRVTTTATGGYVLPFYWAAEKVPGSIASALAMLYYSDNSYTANNQHGSVTVGPDASKILGRLTGKVAPAPTTGGGAADLFLKFFFAVTPDLKGMNILKQMVSDFKSFETEQQACVSRIDFSFYLPPKVQAVGVRTG